MSVSVTRRRVKRLNAQVQREISEIIRTQLRDPRVATATVAGVEMTGDLSLAFLHEERRGNARSFLSRLEGVSQEMVARVMFFALGHPAVPLTGYVLRVSLRMGLIRPDGDPDGARSRLEKIIPKDLMRDFYSLFNEHGRKYCLVSSPRCRHCPVRQHCRTGLALAPSG